MITAYTGSAVRAAEKPLLDRGAGDALMARAAYGLASAAIREMHGLKLRLYGGSAVVLVGKGNNGGDGLYAGALLRRRGMRTIAILTADEAHPGGMAAFSAAGGIILRTSECSTAELALLCSRADVLIDAVLGTGARGGLRGPVAELVEAVAADPPGLVLACDVPSGVNADTGEADGPVLPATLTVTFGAAKSGLLTDPGADYAGRIEVVPLGIEPFLGEPAVLRLEPADVARLLPQPGRRSHKYSRGVLGIVAGTGSYPGAAVLACQGALAAGVGMVRYLGPPSVAALVNQACPEVVCSTGDVADAHVQAWLVGPGLVPAGPDGPDAGSENALQLARARDAVASGLPVVVDAGALPGLPPTLGPQAVLTPHAGELATLLTRLGHNTERAAVEHSPLETVRRAADITGATVLLKGATTLITEPGGAVFSQSEGTPWMATAGSGDVLAGILGALLAQREPGNWAETGALAASLHGLAGSLASAGGPVTAVSIAAEVAAAWSKVSKLSN
ncbi:NAD(P)H-hydrate epimerase [Pseudarthrobacter sp. J64]|uniref:NAD(P)H-hydrate epimerase n=1 Tax=Pseudarthrobacter sp. J64 TaxID=3116485 RepID=UPI002E81B379|nr:NAD(P)H-hydrate epimerase [Pseudarthrobacter sp. J64]MEE2568123.1 NAD(P)H-hydrate epimerase [Pseudarthrobacter sp. J64]